MNGNDLYSKATDTSDPFEISSSLPVGHGTVISSLFRFKKVCVVIRDIITDGFTHERTIFERSGRLP